MTFRRPTRKNLTIFAVCNAQNGFIVDTFAVDNKGLVAEEEPFAATIRPGQIPATQ
jgi:hypothetical protein